MNVKYFAAAAIRGWLLLAVAALLAACGGGGGGGAVKNSPPPTSPPPTPQPPTPSNPYRAPERTGDAARPYIDDHLYWTQADAAHVSGITGAGVVVGVVDSGVNHNHPALQGRVTNLTYVPSPPNDLSKDDIQGHGTAVAQIIAGKTFGQWPGGIAPDAKIVSARIIWDKDPEDDGSGEGNPVDTEEQPMALGMESVHDDLIAHGAKIMNNSWGGLYWKNPQSTTLIAQDYSRFINENGGLVVFATGNEGRDNPHDMAALPSQPGPNGELTAAYLEKGWLAVTALDVVDHDLLASYANACGIAMHYCLAASGSVAVTGTDDTADSPTYWSWTGTSLAAPQVSGAAALVWQQFPYLTNEQVKQVLLGTADDLGVTGVDPVFGYGRLNVARAVNGPAKFDWGDFVADVPAGKTSVWLNDIIGDGGLIKSGAGSLAFDMLTVNRYAGDTRVLGGTLYVDGELTDSNVVIGADGTLSGGGTIGRSVDNGGTFLIDAQPRPVYGGNYGFVIKGDYVQQPNSRISVTIDAGTSLKVLGEAELLGGALNVLGPASLGNGGHYVYQNREVILEADGGLHGEFDELTSAAGVLLQATLGYDSTQVWLDITRLDVTAAAMSMSNITQASLASAQRMEVAFAEIDAQQGGAGPITANFIASAGRIQASATEKQALSSLQSLSGELHAAADAASLDNLEASRRALSARFGKLAGQSQLQGDWYQPLGQPGQGGSAFGQFRNDGWLMGSDRPLGANAAVGFAFGANDADGFLGTGYDRSHERQTQARFYAGAMRGNGYALGQFGVGRYERQLRRKLLLGDSVDGVATDYAGRFTTANLEAGYRFGNANQSLVPYAGIDYVRLDRDGFIENGATGFGLKANGGIAERTLAVTGLRAERAWKTGSGIGLALRGYAEWQRSVSERGLLMDASFVGAESWSPLYGEGFERSSGLFGVGLDAALSRRASLSFGYDQRFGSFRDDRQWSAKLRYGF